MVKFLAGVTVRVVLPVRMRIILDIGTSYFNDDILIYSIVCGAVMRFTKLSLADC